MTANDCDNLWSAAVSPRIRAGIITGRPGNFFNPFTAGINKDSAATRKGVIKP